MSLLLFDVDGTLVKGLGAYESTLKRSIKETFERDVDIDLKGYHGHTDRFILKDLLDRNNVDYDERDISLCLYHFGNNYQANKDDTQIIDGVFLVIPELSLNHDLGLVTGNVGEMARKKLELFHNGIQDLNSYFRFGGFGDESYERSDLVGKAIFNSASYSSNDTMAANNYDIWVIGDTPRDIEAGKAHDAKTVGVTTGEYDREALKKAGAYRVIDHLRELEMFVNQ